MRGVLVDDQDAAAWPHDAAQFGDGPARQQGVLERLDADGGVELAGGGRNADEITLAAGDGVGEPRQGLG